MRKAVLLVNCQEVFCLNKRVGTHVDHRHETGTVATLVVRAAASGIALSFTKVLLRLTQNYLKVQNCKTSRGALRKGSEAGR